MFSLIVAIGTPMPCNMSDEAYTVPVQKCILTMLLYFNYIPALSNLHPRIRWDNSIFVHMDGSWCNVYWGSDCRFWEFITQIKKHCSCHNSRGITSSPFDLSIGEAIGVPLATSSFPEQRSQKHLRVSSMFLRFTLGHTRELEPTAILWAFCFRQFKTW